MHRGVQADRHLAETARREIERDQRRRQAVSHAEDRGGGDHRRQGGADQGRRQARRGSRARARRPEAGGSWSARIAIA